MHCVQGQQQRLAEGKEVRWETMEKKQMQRQNENKRACESL